MRLACLLLMIPSLAAADRIGPATAGAPLPAQERVAIRPPARPPLPPQPPHASVEVATQGKRIAGAYTCKGNRAQVDGSSAPLVAKLAIKLELDNAWIATQWSDAAMKRTDYRTYDDTSKQWTRFSLASDGSHQTLTSLGDKAGEWLWEGVESSSTGSLQVRHHEKLAGKQLELWGEALLGGTWQKVYTASCKR
ncbi:MAG: hypothetical protein ABI467_19760 [Kofleriaceae bacterium]